MDSDNQNQTGALKMANSPSPFQKIGFKPQTTDYSAYGYEMIFIPTIAIPNVQWQGTVIINKFDPSGAFLGDYVADVVMRPDPNNPGQPDVSFEVSFEDGYAYVEYGDESGYEDLGDPGPWGVDPPIAQNGGAHFKKANFQFQPGRGALARRILKNPRVRWVSKCTNQWTAAGWAACGIGSIFTGGATFTPCAAQAMTLAVTGCTLQAVFGP